MKTRRFTYATISFCLILLSLSHSIAVAARCQIGTVVYSIPQQAAPGQQIKTATTINGSCVSNGEDYYLVRVDLVDVPSSSIVSSNSTPIGYNATNFTTTVENMATTPSNNGTWHIVVNVYVIREGGTSGSYLLDYRNSTSASIEIGAPTPIPEYPAASIVTLAIGLGVAFTTLLRRKPAPPKD